MWKRFNNNPCFKSVGDCAVRAVSAALCLTWLEAYDLLCQKGREICNLPSADEVWSAVLIDHGFRRRVIPSAISPRYTAEEFCRDHPRGVYVLAFGGHVATVREAQIWDSWDSSNEVPVYYFSRL